VVCGVGVGVVRLLLIEATLRLNGPRNSKIRVLSLAR
jgi:hypothetical protein